MKAGVALGFGMSGKSSLYHQRHLIPCSGEDEKQLSLLLGLLKVFACKVAKTF
jgi:hypothetical protein